MVALAWRGWSVGAGFALGSAISWINFRWLKHAVDSLSGKRAQRAPAAAGVAGGLPLPDFGRRRLCYIEVFFHQPASHSCGTIRFGDSGNRRNLFSKWCMETEIWITKLFNDIWPVWETRFWELWRASRSAAVGQLRGHAIRGGALFSWCWPPFCGCGCRPAGRAASSRLSS